MKATDNSTLNPSRKRLCLLLFLSVVPSISSGQSFDRFLVSLASTPTSYRQTMVDSFSRAEKTFPLAEDSTVHFIYVGRDTSVSCPGDLSGWNPSRASMSNVTGTDLWYRTEHLPSNARLDYKIVRNGEWILDPRNPNRSRGGFGENSELRMPKYLPPAEVMERAGIPHGAVIETTFVSKHLGNSRTIAIYLPPDDVRSGASYPVILVHDGLEYLSLCNMNTVIDNLVADASIEPVIAVFVPPVEREAEYDGAKQETFTAFIVDELLPWVDASFRTRKDAASRAVFGSSSGGNIALWIAMNHPETFGNVGTFSPYVAQKTRLFIRDSTRGNVRCYVNHGIYDHLPIIHRSVDALLPLLRMKGFDLTYQEYPEGHSYGLWRAHVDDALLTFFPAGPIKRE